MVVYELKDPAAFVAASPPKLPRADLETAVAVLQPQVVGNLSGLGYGPKGRNRARGKRSPAAQDPLAWPEVKRLVAEINALLEAQGAKLHLVMVADAAGVGIDLYDCSDNYVCRSIHDITIELGDLPILLSRLMQKTGIMIDTLS